MPNWKPLSTSANEAIDKHPSKREWSLEPMRMLCKELAIQPEKFAALHIAGSNGKGSVAAMASSILREAGLRAGTNTSPHLVEASERIQVNGKKISEKIFQELAEEVGKAAEKNCLENGLSVSFFEKITAMAFLHFQREKVDLVVVEVGLGGRLDATNLLAPRVAVITNASLEHTDLLGKTVGEIASEKSGIIKKNSFVATGASGEALEVIRKKCFEQKAELIEVNEKNLGAIECTPEKTCFELEGNSYCTRLLGRHQALNAALAVKAVQLLGKKFPVDEKAIAKGLQKVEWRGRLEVITQKPLLVLDCCHNPAAAQALAEAVNELWPRKKVFLVAGVLADKDVEGVLKELSKMRVEKFFACAPDAERALPTATLAGKAESFFSKEKTVACPSVREAMEKALGECGENEMVIVTGSLYTVGEALKLLENDS